MHDVVARYYEDATAWYQQYAGETGGWHYGIWEPDVVDHATALIRSNELLVRGLAITPRSRILDVGCGIGGFAVWAAKVYGCFVTGITTCEAHVRHATELARREGLSDRCRFLRSDMEALDVEKGSVDLVIHQESLCCAGDKRRALSEAHRVLRPGGHWRAIDFARRPGDLSSPEQTIVRHVLEGFRMASLCSRTEILAHLEPLGFLEREATDLTPLVLPTAELIIRESAPLLRAAESRPAGSLFAADPVTEANLRGHFAAGVAYSAGLAVGCCRHELYAARKGPEAAQEPGRGALP